MSTRVLVDANVLFSRTLRDWLCLLYLESDTFFSVYWTEDIVAEVIYRLRRQHPDWPGHKVVGIRDKICETFEGGRVDDFVPDGSFPGTDANDAHVHAAAIACSATILLTGDAGFSAPGVAENLPYEVYSPDEFFVLVDDSSPEKVIAVTETQQSYWLQRHDRCNLPRKLTAAGCPNFAERVLAHLQAIQAAS
ncbi:MAG: PIN domain-containing protein [Candidatus Saccharimonas sp.]